MKHKLLHNKIVLLVILFIVISIYPVFNTLLKISTVPIENGTNISKLVTQQFPSYVSDPKIAKINSPAFDIVFPSTWSISNQNPDSTTGSLSPTIITLTKDYYKLVINRAEGGHLCIPSDNYKDISNNQIPSLKFRLTNNPSGNVLLGYYIFCGKPKEGSYSISQPLPTGSEVYLTVTEIGGIKLYSDNTDIADIDDEVLQIIQSIRLLEN